MAGGYGWISQRYACDRLVLEQRGLIERNPIQPDFAAQGRDDYDCGPAALDQLRTKIQTAQDQILALDQREREQLLALLARVGRA